MPILAKLDITVDYLPTCTLCCTVFCFFGGGYKHLFFFYVAGRQEIPTVQTSPVLPRTLPAKHYTSVRLVNHRVRFRSGMSSQICFGRFAEFGRQDSGLVAESVSARHSPINCAIYTVLQEQRRHNITERRLIVLFISLP